MVIIAFCTKTSKILPRVICRHFRHCAPIVPAMHGANHPWVMYQFVRRGTVIQIPLSTRDMNILRAHGWVFMHVNTTPNTKISNVRTCVDLSQHVIGRNPRWYQTPDGLYRELQRQSI